MTGSGFDDSDMSLDALASRMFDAGLSDAERQELLGQLPDGGACDRFIDHVMLHVALRKELDSPRLDELQEIFFSAKGGKPVPPPPVPTLGLFGNWFGFDWRVKLVAVLLLAPCLWFGYARFKQGAPGREDVDIPPNGIAANEAEAEFVARIVRLTPDVEWGHPGATGDFLLRLKTGETVRIAKGLVQIEFFSGALIILQGPAVFTLSGAASGHLEDGRLTGNVSHGNFRLKTAVADVIDLGTAFGVSVDPDKGTDVLVFEGEVQVIPNRARQSPGEVLNMTEGMAARIRADGTTDYEIQPDDAFARSIADTVPPGVVNEISLVDIVCGGNGLKSRLSGAIDPTSGQLDRGDWSQPEEPRWRKGNVRFLNIEWHPLIDGVFVPTGPHQKAQVDSLGSIVELPFNLGDTWGPIWARRWESSLDATDAASDLWGGGALDVVLPRLRATTFGIMGMHANVGITFDLRKICLYHHRPPAKFQATLVNLANRNDSKLDELDVAEPKADFRVFVDGELRYSRLAFRRVDGDAHIDIPLSPTDKRLTFLSTDSDGQIRYDHVTLIDPILVLATPAAQGGDKNQIPQPPNDGVAWKNAVAEDSHE